MCGRFTLTADGQTVRAAFGLSEPPFDHRPRYNIAPQQDVLVVAKGRSGRKAGVMRWGLVPAWSDTAAEGVRMINARSETAAERAAFREAFERRRCLIPADGFYEWRTIGNVKIPMLITRGSGEPFAFAGLWERWQKPGGEPLFTCTILTTSPAPVVAAIHDRMPVMLRPDQYDTWLDAQTDVADLHALLKPYDGDDLQAHAVSNRVNYVENDDAECIDAVLPSVSEQTSLF